MPHAFGVVSERSRTPARAMILLIAMGLILLWGSSLMPTINSIIQDGVRAVGVLVAYYYGLAGMVAFWVFRNERQLHFVRWLWLAVYPALSGLSLILLGIYAMTTFDRITNIVGIGGLAIGIVFFRPRRFVLTVRPSSV
jgi:amino acid transporter